ncbi:hypothetical protein [Enterobacter ludwigii]|uniref:hypothetical protein n=1 Tax=Enterobacter ludwigii TaxID=299767 RepID=UPI002ACAE861|nr:hypothetical protein [Enterobacter ludwigii]MDZ5701870.1 hypothetical protein [Enterobacter ludwigii]
MLEFIRDLFTSFRQTSLERVKSPFLGAFAFSWVAFNWPMLAILFFSKKEIESRIEYINSNFEISSYLLAPLCTSALIAFLLPQINKIITKIQDKPNSETIELTLSSKIRVAELQQSIAEIEARKKLADKKEERFIEESIESIKTENSKLNDQVLSYEIEVKDLQARLSDSKAEENSLRTLLLSEKESLLQSENVRKQLSDINLNLNSSIKELEQVIANTKSNIKILNKDISELRTEKEVLIKTNENLSDQLTTLAHEYQGIFEISTVNNIPHLELTKRAKRGLHNINTSMLYGTLDEIVTNKLPIAEHNKE